MRHEEPAHLVDVPKRCTHCNCEGMHKFLYCNNSSQLQLRYSCLECGNRFTNGGVAYKKKNRRNFKAWSPSPSHPSPSSPGTHNPPASPPPHDPASPSSSTPSPDLLQLHTYLHLQLHHLQIRVHHLLSALEPTESPIRPRFPSAVDHERAHARMTRDADAAKLLLKVEAAAGPSGAQVVTGVRVTRAADDVVPDRPSKLIYQVRISVSGAEDVVQCVLMDLESGIPDNY